MDEQQPQKQQHKLAAWLDQLQQESWQLELLISGFAIFLLVGAYEPIHTLQNGIERLAMQRAVYWILDAPYHAFLAVYYILLLSLILHVILRGLWISTVGLRYVSGDIDYENLGYKPRYKSFLQTRMGSFDRYIERLEQICSIWFSYTFLLIFCLLSMIAFFLFLAAIQFGIRAVLGLNILQGGNGLRLDSIVSIFLVLFGLIYAFDFLSLGLLKRSRWLGKIYYPIYRLMSWLTFANFYRPLYYNLIDNRFGRRIAFALIPIILLTILLMSVLVVRDPYMPYGRTINGQYTKGDWFAQQMYEDQVEEVNLYVPSVPTAFPQDDFYRVFLPYVPASHDEDLVVICPDIKPARYAGVKLQGGFNIGKIVDREMDGEALQACFQQMYRFSIDDTVQVDIPLRFTHHDQRKQFGLQGVLDLQDLSHGEHKLVIERQRLRRDSIQWMDYMPIYFWTR